MHNRHSGSHFFIQFISVSIISPLKWAKVESFDYKQFLFYVQMKRKDFILNCYYSYCFVINVIAIIRAVFKWLSKNQNQSNYSDQSQQERTARWTNHSSQQSPVTRSKRGKNHAYMVRLVLVLLLIDWKPGATLFSQSLSVAIAIT